MAEGPAAGREVLNALADEPSLRSYYLLPSARAHLLEKLGRREEARAEFERAYRAAAKTIAAAASLTENLRQRNRLLARAMSRLPKS